MKYHKKISKIIITKLPHVFSRQALKFSEQFVSNFERSHTQKALLNHVNTIGQIWGYLPKD